MHGVTGAPDPGRFGTEIEVMAEMGWSWEDLQNAPAPLVDEIVTRLQARSHWFSVKREQEAAKIRNSHGH